MKDLYFQGQRLLTTDRVADAVLHYAQTLAASGRTDVIEFPVIQDGALSTCTLLLAQPLTLATVTVPQAYPDSLAGAEAAADAIWSRIDALAEV